MKLKLVVASMSLLGLVSIACATTSNDHATKSHYKVRKVKKHHVVKHETTAEEQHEEKIAPAQPVSYKNEISPAPICSISQTEIIMDETTQNLGRALPNQCNPGWFNRFHLSGGATVDFGKWGDRNAGFEGENYKRFSLNDVYLNMTTDVNEWAKAFISISFNDATPTGGSDSDTFGYSAVYPSNRLNLEQAYATFGNFEVSPIYVQVGKMFQDFSRYEIHAITRSMTQVLSEALETSGRIGFIVPMGFHGSIFAFDDPIRQTGRSTSRTNYGFSFGFDSPGDQLDWAIGVDYLYNMIGAQDVAHAVSNFTGGGYHSRAGAVAAYADLNSGPFMLDARWTGAVKHFNPNDLPKNGSADLLVDDVVAPDASGARPWAAGIQAGYVFEAYGCRNHHLYVGYQTSHEAAGIGLPEHRWIAGYGVDLFGKNTLVGIELDHDIAYNNTHGGTNDNTNLISLRAGVQFG